MASITVSVKATNGDKHAVGTDKSATVAEFKEAVAAKAGVAAGQQRLIYKGMASWRRVTDSWPLSPMPAFG